MGSGSVRTIFAGYRSRSRLVGFLAASSLVLAFVHALMAEPAGRPMQPRAQVPRVTRFDLGATDDFADYAGLLFNPHGLAIAIDGDVVVADTGNDRVQRFTAAGDLAALWGGRGTSEGKFHEPWGIAVALDGGIYVADTANNRVQRFDSAGAIALPHQWGAPGSGVGQLNQPRGIAVGSDGSVYVADTGNSRIQVFSPGGTFVRTWGTLGSDAGELDHPSGVAVTGDGTVFVADTGNRRIQLFDTTGQHLSSWSAPVGTPVSIAVAQAHAWVVDSETGSIHILTSVGIPVGTADLGSPALAVVADESGGAYATDESSIYHLTSDGDVDATVRSTASHPWVFPFASALAAAPDDSIYVAMAGYDEIRHFDSTGQLAGRIRGDWSEESTGCLGPGTIKVAFDGTLNVVDVCAGEIERYEPDGTSLGTWTAQGTGAGEYRTANGLALAPDGRFFIADSTLDRVFAYAADGAYITSFGREGSASGEFQFPDPEEIPPLRDVGMTFDGGGRLVVADAGNKRLQRFAADGTFLRSMSAQLESVDPDQPATGIPGDVASVGDDVVATDPEGGLVMLFGGAGDASSAIGDRCAVLASGLTLCHPHGHDQAEEFPGTISGVAGLSDGTIAVLDFEKVLVYTVEGLLVRRYGLYGTGTGAFRVERGGLSSSGSGALLVDDDRERLVALDLEGTSAWALPHLVGASGVTSGTRATVPFVDLVGADASLGGMVAAQNDPSSARLFAGPAAPFNWLVPPAAMGELASVRRRADNSTYLHGDTALGERVLRRMDDSGNVLVDVPLGDDAGAFDVDRNGTTYVIGGSGETVEVRREDVPGIVIWGPGGNVEAEFGKLADLSVAPDGDVAMADSERGVVELRSPDGVLMDQWDGGASPFSQMTALWWAPDGGLWVADRGGTRIQVFDDERKSGWRAEYFRDSWLTDHFATAEVLPEPRHNWGTGAPGIGLGADFWSARISRVLDLTAGEHHFEATVGGGGFRLWIDDELVADAWNGTGGLAEADVTLAAGLHAVVFEFRDRGGASSFALSVSDEVVPATVTPTGVPSPTPTRPPVVPRATPSQVPPGTRTDVKRLILPARDLVYLAQTHRLLVTVPELEADAGWSLAEIDPERASQIIATTNLEPLGSLAVSSDGQRAYVGLPESGRVLDYDALAVRPDADFRVGESGVEPGALAVDPADASVVAATLKRGAERAGVAIFADGVRRPQLTGPSAAPSDVIAYGADGATIYSHRNDIAGPIHELAVTRSGVTVTRSVPGLVSRAGASIQYADGRLYMSSFDVIDALSLSPVGRFSTAAGGVLLADPSSGKAYAAWSGSVHVFDLETREELAAVPVQGMSADPFKMVRWGADGLAMLDGSRVWLVRDPRFAPPPDCCTPAYLPALLTQP